METEHKPQDFYAAVATLTRFIEAADRIIQLTPSGTPSGEASPQEENHGS